MRVGRAHLYEARGDRGHGNGTMSCSSCHVFGHTDLLGWDLGDEARNAIAAYARDKPRASRGRHEYTLEAFGLDPRRERERFAFYLEHHGVGEEP